MADLENTLYMDLVKGRVTIELRPDLAPGHVARIKKSSGKLRRSKSPTHVPNLRVLGLLRML